MEEVKTKKKLSKGEITWISIEGFVAAVGLFFLILGILSDYLAPKRSATGTFSNWILNWQTGFQTWSKTSLSLRWVGVIIILIATIVALITLNHYAKKSDVNDERAVRRAQRLQILSQSAPATEPAAPAAEATVEVASKPVAPEAPKADEEPKK